MGTIIDTRLANLLALAANYRFSREFCEKAGISPSYLSQLRSGTKTLGNGLSREIEERLGLAEGALDEPIRQAAPSASTLQAETLTAAYAMQGMEPAIRSNFVRLILSVAATQVAESTAGPLAEPFEVTYGKPADSKSNPAPAAKRSRK